MSPVQVQQSRQIQDRHRRCVVMLSACVFGLLLLSGCGRATYERRMQQTIELAKYRQKLDDNLSLRSWNQNGVEVRVPMQFMLIRGPEPPKKGKDGEVEVPEELPPDPRQPEFLTNPLPGLIGAWTADVDLAEAGTSQAYMYVLSNYEMWTEPGQGEAALKFNLSIAPNAVVDGLTAKLPEPEEWISETHPRSGGFVASKRMTAAMVVAKLRLPVISEAASQDEGADSTGGEDSITPAASSLSEIDVNCKMYLVEKKDIKVMVLFIVPANVSDDEKLSLDTAKQRGSRVAMCLETLSVSSRKPKLKSKDGSQKSGGGRPDF